MLVVTAEFIAHYDGTSGLMGHATFQVLLDQGTALDIMDTLLVLLVVEQYGHLLGGHGWAHNHDLCLVGAVVRVETLF